WTITPSTYQVESNSNLTSNVAKIYFTAPGTYSVSLHAVYTSGISDTTRANFIFVAQGPTAKFSSSIAGPVNPITPVYFYDSSTGTPNITAWKWTFVPNKVSYVGGTGSTSKNPIITFDSATNYAVTLKVTDSIGTNSITKYFSVTYFGLDKLNADSHQGEIKIYPNPAQGSFEISSVDNSVIQKIEVTDITGKNCNVNYKFNSPTSLKADCSALSQGIYFVKTFLNDGSSVVVKINIQ
ncbi:MAG: T9SS type A sorting domain-containing protein, partial [Bacteroidia bacterium]